MSQSAPHALARLNHSPDAWLHTLEAHRYKYRAYGAVRLLKRYAKMLGQRWVRASMLRAAFPN